MAVILDLLWKILGYYFFFCLDNKNEKKQQFVLLNKIEKGSSV